METCEDITNMRLAPSTKKQYERKIEKFFSWLYEVDPSMFNELYEVDLDRFTVSHFQTFFGVICKKLKKESETEYEYASFQHVNGYRSAIKYLFAKNNLEIPIEFQRVMDKFLDGYERNIATQKMQGLMKISEGKSPLSFAAYKLFAQNAMTVKEDIPLGTINHLFLVLCWNLLARSVSVSNLMFNHITWENDSLIIVFPSHKGDQEGKNAIPKHLYANPLNPFICPVLSMAVYLFSSGKRLDGSKNSLFVGGNTENRFSKWLKTTSDSLESDLLGLGIVTNEIGTHSFRKGITSFLSGIPGGPSPIAIYLRAGWSLGNVQNRYIVEGAGNDQLCGRVASGLSLIESEFAVLPPHFDNSFSLSTENWIEILPDYSFYCNSFRQVLPFLLASLVYHKEFLFRILSSKHPLFLHRIWHDKYSFLQEKVLSGVGENPISQLRATGIPPHILIANEMRKATEQIGVFRDEMKKMIDEVPQKVKNVMLDNFQIEGAVPITFQQVNDLVKSMETSLFQRISQAQINTRTGSTQSDQISNNSQRTNQYQSFTWGGRIHPIPENFQFPTCNCLLLWDLWWIGKSSENLAPFRNLQSFDFTNQRNKVLLSKAKYIMNWIIGDTPTSTLNVFTQMEKDNFFANRFSHLISTIYPDSSNLTNCRIGELNYVTVYDLLKKFVKQNKNE